MGSGRFNGAFTCSAIAIAVTLLALVLAIPPVAVALFGSSATVHDLDDRFADLLARHDDAAQLDADRFNGRSIFYAPRPRPRVTAPVVRRDPEPVEREPVRPIEPIAPPIPTRYEGPSLKALVADVVWFEGGMQVAIGEEKNGVSVIAVSPPWAARLSYRGWEGEVYLFGAPPGDEFFGAARSDAMMPGIIAAETPEQREARLAEMQKKLAEEGPAEARTNFGGPARRPEADSAGSRRRGRPAPPANGPDE